MATKADSITEALHAEIDQIPEERRALLLRIVHSYREGLEEDEAEPSAAASFREGWRDIKAGRIHPIETLWDGIDAD